MTGQFFLKAKNIILLKQGKWRCPFLD